jgi:hypothetical protein
LTSLIEVGIIYAPVSAIFSFIHKSYKFSEFFHMTNLH